MERSDGIFSYFYDKEHDLDKFVGAWEGKSVLSYFIDALALDLHIIKGGKPVALYVEQDKRLHKILGTHLRMAPKYLNKDGAPVSYFIPFDYGDDEREEAYRGRLMTYWEISDDHQEIKVYRHHVGCIECKPHFPDNAKEGSREVPMWTLRRVR